MQNTLLIVIGLVAAAGVLNYVIADGFDLGVGILFPFARDEKERDLMMNSITPFWDGNETWLVLGGALLYGAFPKAYATLLPALYLPVMLMLFSLILRGVAFEFRPKASRSRTVWSWVFALGSLVAACAQGLMLGAFVQGFPLTNGAYAGGSLGFLSPASLFCGIGLALGDALLGATWLVLKTHGPLQMAARRWSRVLVLGVGAAAAVVTVGTPFFSERIAERWLSWPHLILLAPLPLLAVVTAITLWRSVTTHREATAFQCALGLFALCYLGLGLSCWPYVVPGSAADAGLTLAQAAAPPSALHFDAIILAIVLPLVLAYSAFNYWAFRGKAAQASYH